MFMSKEDQDDELAALRRKKMAELLARQKEAEIRKEIETKSDDILEKKINAVKSYLFTQKALIYFNEMKNRNIQLYETIKNKLFPPEVVLNIDLLLMRIQRGYVPRGIISELDIQYLERELLGIKSTIKYKKRGEEGRMDLSSLFKKNDD